MRAQDPDAIVGWLSVGDTDTLAGHAFLVGRDIALTCAHVVRDHLRLDRPTPAEAPEQTVQIRFRKLDCVVSGKVRANGWFPAPQSNTGLADIAIVQLEQALQDFEPPLLARRPPDDGHRSRAYGAAEGYQAGGQNAKVLIGEVDAFGRHDLSPDGTGFTAEPGFSGGPVMDRGGPMIWGMITTLDEDKKVSFAILSRHLNEALSRAGLTNEVRVADRLDEQAAAATSELLAQLGAKEAELEGLARNRESSERRIAELEALVASLEASSRKPETAEAAEAALEGLTEGSPDAAAGFFREQVRRGKELAERGRRDAALASRQLGQLLALSNVAEAAAAFREAVALDPTDRDAWISLGEQEQALGSLARAAAAFERAQDLPAVAGDPLTVWPLFCLGDVHCDQGDLAGALDTFQKGHDIAASLAAHDPDHAAWQRDLSVSHNKIGEVRRREGDLASALDAFERSRDIRQHLAARDPDNAVWQDGLAVSYSRIGGVRHDQRDFIGALDAFHQSFNIAASLAARDPNNAGWQRGLSFSLTDIGDVRRGLSDLAGALDAYRKSLEIRERLAARDPNNAGWQHDLALCLDRIGSIRHMQGDLPGALEAFQRSLSVAASSAVHDATNTEWQRDFSVGLCKVGLVRRDQGDLAGALDVFREALAISERLARLDPSNVVWQKDVAAVRTQVAALEQAQPP